MKHQKRIRLKRFSYKGCFAYFITICTCNHTEPFKKEGVFDFALQCLKEKAEEFGFKVWAYCFMPDHLHLLIEGKQKDSKMKIFMSSFKQFTGYYYKKEYNSKLWQDGYFDHVLRNEEDRIEVVRYILENPVRQKLVKSYRDYKFSGSFEFDIKTLGM
ncbi:MAG: transposase [Pseudomonadota bacterium]